MSPGDFGPLRPRYDRFEPLVFTDADGAEVEHPDYPAIAEAYCRDIVAGEVIACRYVKLAAKKYLKMLASAKKPGNEFTFSALDACDFVGFFEAQPLIQDNWREIEEFDAEPWQIWVGCALYGFRDRRGARWVGECYLEIPRKSFKSGLAGAIALYDCGVAPGRAPIVLIGAASKDQSDRGIFGPIRQQIDSNEDLREQFGFKANAERITCSVTNGLIAKVTKAGDKEDGWNPSTIVLEELHAQKQDVYDVLNSAKGARAGQLMFQITTAGRVASGLAWGNRKAAIAAVDGTVTNTRHFGLIFTVDKEDLKDRERLFTDLGIIAKANPMIGVSVNPVAIVELGKQALQEPSKRGEFLRTRLNIWNNVSEKLVDISAWDECYQPGLKIEQFKGQHAWMGLDLSIRRDLTARATIFEDQDGILTLFCRYYLAEGSPMMVNPALAGMIHEWIAGGWLTVAGTHEIDHSRVADDILADAHNFIVEEIGADPKFAAETMRRLEIGGQKVVRYTQHSNYMTAPIESLVAKIAAGRVRHDGNPITTFCFANVEAETRRDDGIMPIKDDVNSDNKIDGFVAACMALGVKINPAPDKKPAKKQIIITSGAKRLD